MTTDQTFITNEDGKTLQERFKVLIKNTRFFDCLVGYFYTSGFYSLYSALESTEKIRVLIGINTDVRAYQLIQEAHGVQQKLTTKETKEAYSNQVAKDLEQSPDTLEVEQGVRRFLEWVKSGKLEVRAYPTQNIHAKVYIMTFQEGGLDDGYIGALKVGNSTKKLN